MQSIFSSPRLRAQRSGRNIFDVSYKSVFHAPFGAIIPCGHWRLAPGDKVEITEENQLVVPTINRPAFMRLKEHIDYYAVPYSMLWTPAENLFTAQNGYWSTAIKNTFDNSGYGSPQVPNQVPVFDPTFLKSVLQELDNRDNIEGFSMADGAFHLFDQLGYGNMYGQRDKLCDAESSSEDTYLRHYLPVNLFNLLAYQKIYFDYFRNDKYEENSVQSYNIDDLRPLLYTAADISQYGGLDRWCKIFELHQRWKKKDYFTSTIPNNLPDASYIGFQGLNSSLSFNQGFGNVPTMNGIGNVGMVGVGQNSVPGSTSVAAGNAVGAAPLNSASGPVNVSAIRFAFAYDKLLRRMREAGQDFDAQMLAQFGITPIDQRHGKCHYVGGYVNRIMPTSVTVTSDSQTGNIAGNIDNYANNKFKLHYTAKEHCILMAVYSTSLDIDYNSLRLDRENVARHRFDWYHPVFENQGNQPIFGFEYDMFQAEGLNTSTTNGQTGNQNAYNVLGLNRRYSEYKTHVDEIHGLFNPQFGIADYMQWVTAQYPENIQDDISVFTMRDLVFNSRMLRNVVKQDYDGSWKTEPLLVNMYNRVKKISNMSVYGEDFGH